VRARTVVDHDRIVAAASPHAQPVAKASHEASVSRASPDSCLGGEYDHGRTE
jgi:hypothetical protein